MNKSFRGNDRVSFVTRAGSQLTMRPYTLRKGDTLESIAQKRSMSVAEIKKCNSKKDGDAIKVGDTILLPAGKLSQRDNEIIDGITKINQPRIYPTRKGESIMDIIEPRNIAFDEVKRLNPGLNLGTFNNGEKLKLPPGKYTVREKEMLQGCGILPPETVNPLALLVSPNSLALFGAASLAGVYAMYFSACKRYQDHGIKLWGNEPGKERN
jgi:LysM repeat protein